MSENISGDSPACPDNDKQATRESDADSGPAVIERLDSRGVLRLTLNRPGNFNALSHQMLDSLQEALDQSASAARVVVIGATGKAFCAGHDLREMRSHIDENWQKQLFSKCSHFMQTLIRLEQPVIASVQGVAAAAGCQLVANCDLAIAADHCRFGVSGIDLGLFCSTPSVALTRNVARKRAFHLLVTGEYLSASQAVDWGLLNACVPADKLDDEVDALCNVICSKSRVAVGIGKRVFYEQLEKPISDAYALAGSAMACNMMAEDVTEGIDAFFEKRPPVWKDR